MSRFVLRNAIFSAFCALVFSACNGSGSSPAALTPSADTPSSDTPIAKLSLSRAAKPETFTIDGQKMSLGLSSTDSPDVSLTIGRSRLRERNAATSSCATYAPPSISITNPTSRSIVITPTDLMYAYVLILTQCNVVGDAYNVALGQTLPSVVTPTTIGDVKGVQFPKPVFGFAYGITGFVARSNVGYTFAPKSTSLLTFTPAQVNPNGNGYPYSNSQTVTFQPNMSSNLGSVPTQSCATSNGASPSPGCPNGNQTMTGVAVTPQTTSGGSASVACFNTTDPRFGGIPPGSVAAFPGVVKGACEFDTGGATITLGTTVTFTITNPDPDLIHGSLDGPLLQIFCTATTTNGATTGTCPTNGPNGQGFTIGADSAVNYQYFLFGNDPYPSGYPPSPSPIPTVAPTASPAPTAVPSQSPVFLSPTFVSVAAGTPSNGYTFSLPTFASYPVTLKIDGDVNNNLSMADGNPIPCGNYSSDMTQVAPGTLLVNCATGHQQGIVVSYTGGTWQYQHNGVPGQNQDCDASCVAYAAIDLYDKTGTTLIQGDGPSATIHGTTAALATIDPIAINDQVTGQLEDPNGQTITILDSTGSNATTFNVVEANINILNNTNIVFDLRQPTNGAVFALDTYYGGAQFTTAESSLPVGNQFAHIPWGIGLIVQANALGGTGQVAISPPEPAGQHAPPQAFVSVVIPQQQSSPPPIEAKRRNLR